MKAIDESLKGKYCVTRRIDSTSLQCLLDNMYEPMVFDSIEKAKEFLIRKGYRLDFINECYTFEDAYDLYLELEYLDMKANINRDI